MRVNKKGQVNLNLITVIVMGFAALIIATIVALVVVDSLTSANLVTSNRDLVTVTNEVGFINTTGYTLTGATRDYASGTFTITGLVNYTSGTAILLPNATTTAAGVVTNASVTVWNNVTFNYTYNLKSSEEKAQSNIDGNFSAGIDQVAIKVPTVFKIAAVVLILSVLILLFFIWKRMGISGGSI